MSVPQHSCWAVSAPGLEPVTVAELRALGVTALAPETGGVAFSATDDLLAAALDEQVAAERNLPRQRGFERARVLVDHPDLQRRGAAEDVLGARGVLHAGELHDDAIGTLLLDDRLRDAELVHGR